MREMKDSGIDWIEEIPKDWNVSRIKYLFNIGKGLNITKENLKEKGLAVISYGQIHSKVNNRTDLRPELIRYVNKSYQSYYPHCEVKKSDFVFADTSEDYEGCGNCVYKRDDTVLFAGYHTIILHANASKDYRFLAYLFTTDVWRKQIRGNVSGVKVFSISQKILANSNIIMPPETEQQQIADFLDSKCSEIDAITADIQKEITVLEDYKKFVITEAVTKGLNPNVEMKDSGIEWISKMPKHWKILKIGYITQEIGDTDHYMPPDTNEIGGVPYLMIGDLAENASEINFDTCKYISRKDYDVLSVKSKPNLGDVIFARYATIGTVCYVDSSKKFLVSYACLTIKANSLVKGRFLYYYFKSSAFLEEVSQYINSNTQSNIGKESLTRAKITLPSLNEQQSIINYLDSKCSDIDATIADKQKQLEILSDYKKSLIYEYVTGKKEVPCHE